MEKIAIIEIKTMSVKLQIYDVVRNKYFALSKTIDMPINLTKDFYNDNFIKPNIVKDINSILVVYKAIIESYECTDVVCLATNAINEAKNNGDTQTTVNIGIGTLSVNLIDMQCKFVPGKNLKAAIKQALASQLDPVELMLEQAFTDKLLAICEEVI